MRIMSARNQRMMRDHTGRPPSSATMSDLGETIMGAAGVGMLGTGRIEQESGKQMRWEKPEKTIATRSRVCGAY